MLLRTRLAGLAAAAGCALLLSACGAPAATVPAAGTTTTSTTTTSAPMAPTTMAPTSASASGSMADAATLALKMADTSLGSILVDGKGMTLYLYTKDSPSKSVCEDACLAAWPPLIGVPTVGSGVDDSKLGSFQRSDGRTQATYNGWPLYYYKTDVAAGDVTGQNVGGVWFVLDRDGEAIKK